MPPPIRATTARTATGIRIFQSFLPPPGGAATAAAPATVADATAPEEIRSAAAGPEPDPGGVCAALVSEVRATGIAPELATPVVPVSVCRFSRLRSARISDAC